MLPMPAILVNTSPFPLMKVGPPMRLFMDKTVKQAAVNTPASIPVHWAKQVKDSLDRDVHLEVPERLPGNGPTSWICRMIITTKNDPKLTFSLLVTTAPGRPTIHSLPFK